MRKLELKLCVQYIFNLNLPVYSVAVTKIHYRNNIKVTGFAAAYL